MIIKKFKKKFLKKIHNSRFGLNQLYSRNERLINLEYEIATSSKKIKMSNIFYKKCLDNFIHKKKFDEIKKDGVWDKIYNNYHKNIIELIRKDNSLIRVITDDPSTYNLFYGFDGNCKTIKDNQRFTDKFEYTTLLADKILSFAEYLGILRYNNSEKFRVDLIKIKVDSLINKIEEKIEIKLKFENPFPGETGILTKKGILTSRELQAIYQAYKLKIFFKKKKNIKILEIGGGLGRTGFYCYKFGLRDYTLVDLRIPLLCQFNYLSRALSEKIVNFNQNNKNKINLVSPDILFKQNKKYDLVFNSDSFTEIDSLNQKKYVEYIKKNSKYFYSINHESNKNTVRDLLSFKNVKNLSRNPYWLRKGYLEEVFKIN